MPNAPAIARAARRECALRLFRVTAQGQGVLWLRDTLRGFGVGKPSDLRTEQLETAVAIAATGGRDPDIALLFPR